MRRHRIGLAAAVPLVALALAGCGGHGKGPGVATVRGTGNPSGAAASPTPSQDMQAQMLAYARCMRDHGVNMPDPEFAGGGVTMMLPSGASRNDAQLKAAEQACHQYLPNGGAPPSMSPEEIRQLREFAQCMRDHGVQMADPDADTGGISIGGGPAAGPSGPADGGPKQAPDDPNFKNAEAACKDKLPKGRGR